MVTHTRSHTRAHRCAHPYEHVHKHRCPPKHRCLWSTCPVTARLCTSMINAMSCKHVAGWSHVCAARMVSSIVWPQRRPEALMSTWRRKRAWRWGERNSAGRIQAGTAYLTTYTHAHVGTHVSVWETPGEVLFLCCCPIAMDQTRDARSQGMDTRRAEHYGPQSSKSFNSIWNLRFMNMKVSSSGHCNRPCDKENGCGHSQCVFPP